MAQGSLSILQSATLPVMAPVVATVALTDEERHQIAECERIIRFGNEVLSGGHPRIKVPAHLYASKQATASRSPASSSAAVPSAPAAPLKNVPTGPRNPAARTGGRAKEPQMADNLRSFNTNNAHFVTPAAGSSFPVLPGLNAQHAPSSAVPSIPTAPRASVRQRSSEHSGSVQFDPVLLTKSDDLIKAELQLQRQRLERTLGDQLQQNRVASKPPQHADALADFDLADVLMKALQLVQAPAFAETNAHLTANASGNDSESADDDTFYSSKHDTPESHLTHRIPDPDGPDYAEAREGSFYEPPMAMQVSPVRDQPPAVNIATSATVGGDAVRNRQYPDPHAIPPNPIPYEGRKQERGQVSETQEADVPMEIISSQESEEASSSRNSGLALGGQASAQRRLEPVTQHLIERAFNRQQSPILRAHNLSPIAPQPAHVSPLAIAHQLPAPQQDPHPVQATPAQVAALRNNASNGSSPESSPQGRGGKKNKKNKKRKSDRLATNVASPYIKPEPRSPSPISALPYSRPNKRLRQAPRHGQDPIYDESQAEDTLASVQQPPVLSAPPFRDDRVAAYDSPNSHLMRQNTRSVVLTGSPRYECEYRDEFRPVETVRYVRRVSPTADLYQLAPNEVRTVRSISRAALERPYPYHDIRDPPRTALRPATDRDRSRSPVAVEERAPTVMGPPRLPASRIVVDEFGREYIDPGSRPEPVTIRRSVAPRPVYGELDEYYDSRRTTARVIRRSVAPASAHGEPEVVYERAPPPRAASTMPAPSRYDDEIVYHKPASPAAGYTTMRRVVTRPEYALPEHRYYRERDYPPQPPAQANGDFYEVRGNELPREYIVRSTSVRPEMSARPEMVRMTSVRPEPVPGEYGAPIHLDGPSRAYNVRTMAAPPLPQQVPYARQWAEYETRAGYPVVEREEEGGASYAWGPEM